MLRQQAWLTARLIGFSKVPDFDVVFPEKAVERPATEDNLLAFFAGLGVSVIQR